VGATACHWAGSAGDVWPRGGELLPLSGASARAGAGAEVGAELGWLREVGRKGSGGPLQVKPIFTFSFSNKQPQIQILKLKMTFSKLDPKTKVV
jgi:hypothetical protein